MTGAISDEVVESLEKEKQQANVAKNGVDVHYIREHFVSGAALVDYRGFEYGVVRAP